MMKNYEKLSGGKGFPVMEDMTVKLVADYLKEKQSVIIPVGIIEQHGWHLPLSTDMLIARELGLLVAKNTGLLLAPSLNSSFSGGGLAGTINISPAVMSMVVSDTLVSLASQGFKKMYIVLGHGGNQNISALENALKILLKNNPLFSEVMLALFPVWMFDSSEDGWKKAMEEKDWHAGWLETSIVMALAPELVRMDDLKTDEHIGSFEDYMVSEKIVDDPLVISRISQNENVKAGVIGFPCKASPEKGRKLVARSVKEMSEKIENLEKRYDGRYKKASTGSSFGFL